jgi:hypothetical protein
MNIFVTVCVCFFM